MYILPYIDKESSNTYYIRPAPSLYTLALIVILLTVKSVELNEIIAAVLLDKYDPWITVLLIVPDNYKAKPVIDALEEDLIYAVILTSVMDILSPKPINAVNEPSPRTSIN